MTAGGLFGFQPTPETQSAMRIRQTFDKTCAGIRADLDLSDTGKEKSMAAAYLKARTALTEIRATETGTIIARRTALELQLFGVGPGGPLAAADYRDAQDRAEQCAQPKDALKLLDRVTRTGDETLAKAVAGYAVEQGWNAVLDQYAASRPAAQNALGELRQIDADTSNSAGFLARSAIYNPPKPPELQRFSDSMIATLAVQCDDPAATAGVADRAGSNSFDAKFRSSGD
jgi:hypothetical protein